VRKPLDEFYAAHGWRDGRRGECKGCFQAARRARQTEDPGLRRQAVERVRRWREGNADRYGSYAAAYRRTDAYERSLRRSLLKSKYGITPEDYDRMLAEQGGGCLLCGDPPPDGRSLHVDHDEVTDRVRGLLCFRRNAGIGQLRHDPELAAARTRAGRLGSSGRTP
jgi:hypothetical protein